MAEQRPWPRSSLPAALCTAADARDVGPGGSLPSGPLHGGARVPLRGGHAGPWQSSSRGPGAPSRPDLPQAMEVRRRRLNLRPWRSAAAARVEIRRTLSLSPPFLLRRGGPLSLSLSGLPPRWPPPFVAAARAAPRLRLHPAPRHASASVRRGSPTLPRVPEQQHLQSRREGLQYCIASLLLCTLPLDDAWSVGGDASREHCHLDRQNAFGCRCWGQSYSH